MLVSVNGYSTYVMCTKLLVSLVVMLGGGVKVSCVLVARLQEWNRNVL
jgi:hypothetical protein